MMASLALSTDFLLWYACAGAVAKTLTVLQSRTRVGFPRIFVLLSPSYALDAWRDVIGRREAVVDALLRIGWSVPLAALSIYGFRTICTQGLIDVWLYPFAAVLPFYVVTAAMGAVMALPFALVGLPLRPLHDNPLTSGSVAEFWGRRWNRWIGGWLRSQFFRPLRHHPYAALFCAFIASGLWHELVFHLPVYLAGYTVPFGSMLLYFLLQPLGWCGDRALRRYPLLRRCWAWIAVVGPAPLLLNEPLRRIFLLQP
ncbi:MAG: hypothetical protein HN712_17285 [Gemmatimonadetes bacterium]|jgi:hypothetical protein|nr:hypothetical protein [Gemmatimonadota bacterium]MBT6149689.1 hypothetical protein [Gemmatimonadota bacterium]MBT7862073.1 hypothetical protein [Gemmatimonadota bacterium]